jgi:hypothetical protein
MEKYEPNLYILWVTMLLISPGSVYFHADLSVAGQVLDELPIIMLSTYVLFVMRPKHKWSN